LSCARRELAEETGFAASKFIRLGKIYPVPGYSNEVIFIYKAENLRPQKARKDEDEVLRPVIFSKNEIISLFKKRRIVDAKTICGMALSRLIS